MRDDIEEHDIGIERERTRDDIEEYLLCHLSSDNHSLLQRLTMFDLLF